MEGGTEEIIKQRIWKAQGAFGTLKNIWSSPHITQNTKLHIFNSNVKSDFLYDSETWSSTGKQQQRIQIFVNKYLRKILKIY